MTDGDDQVVTNVKLTATDETASVMASFAQRLDEITKRTQNVVQQGVATPI